MPRVVLSNVSKVYSGGVVALRDVSLSVEGCGVVSLLGPNGSGKTTILKLVVGLIRPTRGEVYVDSCKMPQERDKVITRMSAVIENPTPHNDRLPVGKLLDFVCRIRGLRREDLQEIISVLGMESILNKRLNELSRGQYKKTILACALMGKPEIVLLDEPFEALDPPTVLRLSEYLRELKNRSLIILATHRPGIAATLSDRAIVLRDGQIVGDYSKEQLLEKVRHRRVIVKTKGELDLDMYRRAGVIEVRKTGSDTYEIVYEVQREPEVLRVLAADNNVVSISEIEEEITHLYSASLKERCD